MIEALVVRAAAEGNLLPVSSVVFPLIALGVFALMGGIVWSYRDVAHRHAKSGGARPGPNH